MIRSEVPLFPGSKIVSGKNVYGLIISGGIAAGCLMSGTKNCVQIIQKENITPIVTTQQGRAIMMEETVGAASAIITLNKGLRMYRRILLRTRSGY